MVENHTPNGNELGYTPIHPIYIYNVGFHESSRICGGVAQRRTRTMQSPQNMVMRRLAVVGVVVFSSFVGALVGTAVIVLLLF
jgi:hypothetical protein